MKMTVANRLSLSFTALCVGVLAIGLVSVMSLRALLGDLNTIVDAVVPAEKTVFRLQLASTNLSHQVNDFFEVTEVNVLSSMKSDFEARRQEVLGLFTDVDKQLSGLDGFDQEIEVLRSMMQGTEAMVTEINSNMEAYQRSIQALQGVQAKKQELADFIEQADEITSAFVSSTDDPAALKLAYEAKNVVDRSISTAMQLTTATTLAGFNEIAQQFKVTSEQYGALGFKMLRFARNNESFKNSMQAVAEFESTLIEKVISAGGISPLLNNYLQLRSALGPRISESQETLSQNVADLNVLAKQISERAIIASENAESSGKQAQSVVVMVSGVIILVSILVGFLVVISIRRPLVALRSFIRQVGTGDLTQKFKNFRDDEIGDIGQAMNQLVEDLLDVVTGIERQSIRVGEVSTHTSVLAEKTQSMTGQQQHDVQESVRSIAEMSESIKEVARTADQTSAAMQAGQEEAEKIHLGINRTVQSINALNSDMQHATSVIKELDEGVVSIEDILKTIQTIAEQTNLLALNAAIEAARAGEQGRGFAVVADEVRTLANRTQASTEEIRDKITAIQNQSRAAVDTIGRSQESTSTVTDIAQQTGEQFSGFVTRIQHLSADNMSIAAAAEQQSVTTDQMNQLMTVIGQITDETSGIAEEVVTNIQSLRAVATDLDREVKRFKVK